MDAGSIPTPASIDTSNEIRKHPKTRLSAGFLLPSAALAAIEVDASGVRKIKVWDKNSAHERLCKHFGLFREDNSQKPVGEQKLKISFISP
ncbi:hypothetical protein [Nitrosospira multiformis]|uniref:hypothetical protein n=1 Tax=Nitrosospira multiformis TaxID=1231 RepID=UPI000945A6F1|nr:hypothetical protein [Nitrosospira multiformis]